MAEVMGHALQFPVLAFGVEESDLSKEDVGVGLRMIKGDMPPDHYPSLLGARVVFAVIGFVVRVKECLIFAIRQ